MSKNQNTPCGCRCNNADDTRRLTLVLEDGSTLEGVVEPSVHDNPLTAARVETYVEALKEFLSALDREIVSSAIVGDRQGDLLHPERELVDGVRELLDSRIGVALQPHRNRRSSLALLDSFKDQLLSRRSHCSSPVVAESEADTSDAPAMTVQEGGSSDAAPGVEGVSPASSMPRFVAVGEYVYDRVRNLVAGGWPGAVATKWARDLNADVNVAGYMEWEAAK
jgi:hypothetical protein